jgi:nucleoid DNA-binding protein
LLAPCSIDSTAAPNAVLSPTGKNTLSQRRFHLAKARTTKPASRKNSAKPASQAVRPVKDMLTKSALINLISEQNDLTRDTAKAVFATIENAILGSVHPRGVGEFTLPGLLKVSLRKVPARKAGTLVRNPSTGEMMPGAAKPASVRVKIRALSKLKTAAIS